MRPTGHSDASARHTVQPVARAPQRRSSHVEPPSSGVAAVVAAAAGGDHLSARLRVSSAAAVVSTRGVCVRVHEQDRLLSRIAVSAELLAAVALGRLAALAADWVSDDRAWFDPSCRDVDAWADWWSTSMWMVAVALVVIDFELVSSSVLELDLCLEEWHVCFVYDACCSPSSVAVAGVISISFVCVHQVWVALPLVVVAVGAWDLAVSAAAVSLPSDRTC